MVELFMQLAEARPKLAPTIVGVFIANEENATLTGIGVDEMVRPFWWWWWGVGH
jgi:acetylornithine deacetylase